MPPRANTTCAVNEQKKFHPSSLMTGSTTLLSPRKNKDIDRWNLLAPGSSTQLVRQISRVMGNVLSFGVFGAFEVPTALLAYEGECRVDGDALVRAAVQVTLAGTLAHHLALRKCGDGLKMLLEIKPTQTPLLRNLSAARRSGTIFHVDEVAGGA